MTLTTKDYSNRFEIKTPRRIQGEPTFDGLKHLQNELKINAQAISSPFGGTHGHLGLVLSPTDYQLITLTPFIRPADPGLFSIPANQNLTAEEISILQRAHEDARNQFEKVEAVEAALKQHLVSAIDEDYLMEIRNPTTMKLEGSIPNIMACLFDAYGNLTAKELIQKQQTLTNYVYDPSKPIDKVFTLAQDFSEYASFHGPPFQQQAPDFQQQGPPAFQPTQFQQYIQSNRRGVGQYNRGGRGFGGRGGGGRGGGGRGGFRNHLKTRDLESY